jgi:threonine synthase
MVQVVHYFYAYLSLCDESCSDEVQVIVPTGACGNVTSGIVATKMGLPNLKLVCAVNTNDIVHRMLSEGVFSVGECLLTIAPAMDVQVRIQVKSDRNFVAIS